MSLAPHQKATTDLASFRGKLSALAQKAAGWQAHPELETALREMEKAQRALTTAQAALARLPASYTPHASKVSTADIAVDGVAYIRAVKRKAYTGLTGADGPLTVRAVGTPFVTLELPDGTRFAVPRGDITTVAQ